MKTSRLLAVAVATVSLALMSVTPASAAPLTGTLGARHEVGYVALGDSYAYGLGADNPATESYPAVLASRADLGLKNAAVSGATTSEVISSQISESLPALKKARLVTLTAGGDDVGALAVVGVCAVTPTDCQTAIAGALARLPLLHKSLGVTLRTIRATAPHARIVVTGYPLLFDPNLRLEAQALNLATIALNTTISTAVLESRLQGTNVQFVSVVPPFVEHGLGSLDPWINGVPSDAPLHPTTTGYLNGYYLAIAQSRVAH